MTVQIYCGDSREVLAGMAEGSIDCIITSPPYFGLRSYLKKGHPNKAKELGLEHTIEEWLANQLAVFAECRRVLKKRGVMWVNIGDSYYSPRYNGGVGKNSTINGQETQEAFRVGQHAKRQQSRAHVSELGGNRRPQAGVKPKDRLGIPHRLVFALQAQGWWWRDEVVWAKTNTMPESARDRCTRAHEFMFMLTKSQRYHFDGSAYQEPATQEEIAMGFRGGSYTHDTVGPRTTRGNYRLPNGPTKSPHGQGFTRQGRKPVAGWAAGGGVRHDVMDHARLEKGERSTKFGREAGWRRDSQRAEFRGKEEHSAGAPADGRGARGHTALTRNKRSWWPLPTQPNKGRHFATFPTWLIEPAILSSCPIDGVVLDPYGGTGTVALVAERHHRNSIMVDLNEESCEDAYHRVRDAAPLLTQIEVIHHGHMRDTSLQRADLAGETLL